MGKYKCADCDNFMQCEYYYKRKGTSKICAEFDNSFNTIPKTDYENRLREDMAAMLDELDLTLYEQYEDTDLIKVKYVRQAIQEKINLLRRDQSSN